MFRSLFAAAAMAVAPVSVVYAQDAAPPPIEAYGALPAFEDAALSPSGELIAVIATLQGTRALIVLDRNNTLVHSAPIDTLKVFNMTWAGDEHVLMLISQTEDLPWNWVSDQGEFQQMLIVPVGTDERAERVFENDRDIADRVFGFYGLREIDGRWKGYFGGARLTKVGRKYELSGRTRALFEVDIATNKARRIAADPRGSSSHSWLLDGSGKEAATLETTPTSGNWRIFNAENKDLAEGKLDILRIGLSAFSQDGTKVIYSIENEETGKDEYFEVPLDGSGEATQIFADLDIGYLIRDPANNNLRGYALRGEDAELVYLDPQKAEIMDSIRAVFPESRRRFSGFTPDFKTHLVRTEGIGNPGSWYLIDLNSGEAKMFGDERPTIPPESVGPVSTFTYTARDGMEMDGILTLPPGKEPKDLPFINLPHGGPHAHDRERFDWWAQAFASRGYAVLQPNFRGSTNRDETFRRAGYGEWGRKMQTDKTDGMMALAEDGIIDPSRACIMGASYGGYAALAGVTIEQGLYRCAVAVAPVTDIRETIAVDLREAGGSNMMKRVLTETFGDKTRAEYDAVSPRRLADKTDAPILLIHGREDTVVPYRQSTIMADALDDAGKPYKLVELEAEDHWLTRSASRLQMLTEAMEFVLEHNPPD